MTTYEWVHGEAPLSVEEPKLDFGNDEDDNDGKDDSVGVPENVEIDFDLTDLSGVELEAPVDIDWGELEAGDENDDVKIDWDAIDIVSEVQVCRHTHSMKLISVLITVSVNFSFQTIENHLASRKAEKAMFHLLRILKNIIFLVGYF